MHKQRAPQQPRPFSSRKVSGWATLQLSPEAAKDPRARAALKLQAEVMRMAMAQMAIMPMDIRTMEVLGLPLAQPQPLTPKTMGELAMTAMLTGQAAFMVMRVPKED